MRQIHKILPVYCHYRRLPYLHLPHLKFLPRACLKKAFRELRVPVCGKFYPNEGGVAGYGNRIRVKYTAKWGLQIAEMIFQTRSSQFPLFRSPFLLPLFLCSLFLASYPFMNLLLTDDSSIINS
ncbi:DUF6783 domain-containing protein [Blautia sp.]|uniref:DUF6783 domain-containing protein n=1 Tax=Blautia sp. TaxID=1955243 RepID=UPI003FA47FAA